MSYLVDSVDCSGSDCSTCTPCPCHWHRLASVSDCPYTANRPSARSCRQSHVVLRLRWVRVAPVHSRSVLRAGHHARPLDTFAASGSPSVSWPVHRTTDTDAFPSARPSCSYCCRCSRSNSWRNLTLGRRRRRNVDRRASSGAATAPAGAVTAVARLDWMRLVMVCGRANPIVVFDSSSCV